MWYLMCMGVNGCPPLSPYIWRAAGIAVTFDNYDTAMLEADRQTRSSVMFIHYFVAHKDELKLFGINDPIGG